MKFTIIIPCRNEKDIIEDTIFKLDAGLKEFNYQLIIINDFSTDNTIDVLQNISKKYQNIFIFNNIKKGLGGAINLGFSKANGDYVCIFMADQSDDISDLKKYFYICINEQPDVVFGSRFLNGSQLIDYPKKKLILNRLFNYFVKIIFLSNYNDFTNAFKIYNTIKIKHLLPFVSENFNIFLELPLKCISRKMNYKIIPINWRNRKIGNPKFKIKELGSMYFFTLLYCWLEMILLRKNKL
jgi:dolichol-phosphate mannosyltransferase